MTAGGWGLGQWELGLKFYVQIPVSQLRRRTVRVFAVLFALYLCGSLLAGIFLAEISLHLPKRPIMYRSKVEQVVLDEFHTKIEDASVTTNDGTELKAWYIRPQTYSGGTVILLHGITDNREGVAGYARMFLHHGYAVLLPDSREHGESGGPIATYGVKERYDIARWGEWIRTRDTGCIYLFGESMGAAIALQATAVTPGICAAVVESPYSQFKEIAYDRVARQAHVPLWLARTVGRPMIEASLLYASAEYKVDLTQASPEDGLQRSRVPVLIIAGTRDKNIPIRHSYELMRTCASHAQLWVVNADHGGAVGTGPEVFEARVVGWFQGHAAQ